MKKILRVKYVFDLLNYIKGFKLRIFIAVVVNIIFKLLPLVIGIVTSYMVSLSIMGEYKTVKILFITVVVLVIFDVIFSYLDILVSHDTAYKILTNLRNLLYDKINEISPAAMESNRSGDLISMMISDVELLEWFYAHTIVQIIVAVAVPLTALIFIGSFSIVLAILYIPFIALLIHISKLKSQQSDKQGADLRKASGAFNSVIIDGVQGIKDIIIFQYQKHFYNRFRKAAREYNDANIKYTERSTDESRMFTLVIGLGALIGNVLTVILVVEGVIDSAWLLPLFVVSSAVFVPIQEALNMSTNYGMIYGAAERIFNLLQVQSNVLDSGTQRLTNVSNVCIDFKNVTFKYPTSNMNVLNDFSLHIDSGETVAIVGKSGCGKSTIAKLLQRFWDIDNGEIKINGFNIKDIALFDLRNIISAVSQDTYIFNMSIKDNLLLANKNSSEGDIYEAVKNAQAYSFIYNLKNGMDTVIGEKGLQLSGGEKQRVAIAQAMLKNAPVLILDEASASLDSENENLINKSVQQLKNGKTTIIIAHRLSTIKSADKIVLIKNGKVEAVGDFCELNGNNSYFSELIGGGNYK